MYRKLLFLVALACAAGADVNAQATVWSTDVAPILFNKCASCHRPGGIAPFSLTTFSEASTRAASISAAVHSKTMPPWPPDPHYSRLAHERLLSATEINKIKEWAAGGATQGDPTKAPPVPTFNPDGDLAGAPDMIAKIPHYTSTATNAKGDVYQCFVVPNTQSADKFITAFEAIPGNRPIVHHVLVYADTTGTAVGLDAATTEPGYTSFGGIGTDDAILLGGWVPGTAPLKYPTGFGVKLPKDADIVIQIHYPAGSDGQVDSTKIKFFFSPTPVRDVFIIPALNHVTNIDKPLVIPANQTKSFTEQQLLPYNISLLGVAPHMHLIGKEINVFGVSGADTLKFINIKNWDFHWQGFYMFKKMMKVPIFTMLYSNAFYDNTTNNPRNPSNPPILVKEGEGTKDEMMLTYFIASMYQNGDENIVIDPTTIELSVPNTNAFGAQELFEPYPNPASNQLIVKTYLAKAERVNIQVVNALGQVVKTLANNERMEEGYAARTYSVSDLTNGMYQLRFIAGERVKTQKLVVQH
ncbi:MAG: T9SS type A sorting domain-containing protein [Sphingobacteriales bacterium]|nr:MAG: T9SS type A sorting domain-containing protein [Sphingobacteriales bacterium]